MADRPDAYVRKDPGDIIRSGDWNELQIRAREELREHQHTGGDDGALLQGESIDPATHLTVNTLTATGSLYAGGNPLGYENYEIYLRGSAQGSTEGDITFLKIANISLKMGMERGINTAVLNPNGSLKHQRAFDVSVNPSLWNDWAVWLSTYAANGDIIALASYDAWQCAPRGGAAEALLTSCMALEAFMAAKTDTHTPYGLIFPKGGVAMELAGVAGGPNVHLKTTYYGLIAQDRSIIRLLRSPMRQRMYPSDPLVYQDIFDAKLAGAISKLGSPNYDETSYAVNLVNDRRIIRFGYSMEADGNGAAVSIPPGYDTVWVRVLGERCEAIKAYFLDGEQEQVGIWTGGFRSLNGYCPDGSLTDGYSHSQAHQWIPIPAGRAGRLALISKSGVIPTLSQDRSFWLSGLAFSRNPWAHATQSALGYYWASNGGNSTPWGHHNQYGDIFANITGKSNFELRVPVLPSGRDKLLYLVDLNDTGNNLHNGITVNNVPIERFLASYDNPFARHFTSKVYHRYIAARIPAGLVGKNRYLSVRIDMSKQGSAIQYREIGTHDFDTPWG